MSDIDHTTRILDHAREYSARAARWCNDIDRHKPETFPLDRHDLIVVLNHCDRAITGLAEEAKRLEAENQRLRTERDALIRERNTERS